MAMVQKWGNSLAIRIPQALAGQLNIEAGSSVELELREGEIVVRPNQPPQVKLTDLLKNCKPSQLHGETDFGPDVGREIVE